MIANVIIILFSTALFAYWFRCSCLLILRAQTSADYTKDIIASANLTIMETLDALRRGVPTSMSGAMQAIDRDYERVSGLLAAQTDENGCLSPAERTLLSANYSMLKLASRFCGTVLPDQARKAMLEMGAIVQCFANAAGAASNSAA